MDCRTTEERIFVGDACTSESNVPRYPVRLYVARLWDLKLYSPLDKMVHTTQQKFNKDFLWGFATGAHTNSD